MQHILEEHGLLTTLEAANGGKVVGECTTCKLSCKALEQMLHEAQAAADEPLEETGNAIYVKSRRTDCCMRKMITNQQDFRSEKPLIQLIIEEAGHKCWFLT